MCGGGSLSKPRKIKTVPAPDYTKDKAVEFDCVGFDRGDALYLAEDSPKSERDSRPAPKTGEAS